MAQQNLDKRVLQEETFKKIQNNFTELYKAKDTVDAYITSAGSDASTGTVLDLTNKEGVLYNMNEANTSLIYTTLGTILNAYARVLIRAESEPMVIDADIIAGSDFVADTDMYMTVWYNGVAVQFWFEEI